MECQTVFQFAIFATQGGEMSNINLMLPGDPRYQPKALREVLGYDRLYVPIGEIELAATEVLCEIGFLPAGAKEFLTHESKRRVLKMLTTDIDVVERGITKHDIRAWVFKAQQILEPEVGRYLHLFLTSYDPIDSGRALLYQRIYQVQKPKIMQVISHMRDLVSEHAETLQIGRTHGQHAIPITVGFWLATIVSRMVYNFEKMDEYAKGLVGKISGAVGAYNAQIAFGVDELCGEKTFEERVLEKVGLKPARISTQRIPPEPLAYFLFSCTMFSACLGQFGEDCRHLMRSEIGEVEESFSSQQSGSSTMAHKRNPITYEQLAGKWKKNKIELLKVLETVVTDHQRDLVSSSIERSLPVILVNLQVQLDALLRQDNASVPFLRRMRVNQDVCRRNFVQNSHLFMAEALYIALVMAGFKGDAHKFVNHTLVPEAIASGQPVVDVLEHLSECDSELRDVFKVIPFELVSLLRHPEKYVGWAVKKAEEVVAHTFEVQLRLDKK